MRHGGAIPHTLLVYDNQADRNRRIEALLRQREARWNHLIVFTARPASDGRYFRKVAKPRCSRFPSVVDIQAIIKNPDSLAKLNSLVSELREELPKSFSPVVIGDWSHFAYEEIALRMAHEETYRNDTNVICTYSREGFWSLEPQDIARILELHQAVHIGPNIMQMAA